jgi:hypothetical protein
VRQRPINNLCHRGSILKKFRDEGVLPKVWRRLPKSTSSMGAMPNLLHISEYIRCHCSEVRLCLSVSSGRKPNSATRASRPQEGSDFTWGQSRGERSLPAAQPKLLWAGATDSSSRRISPISAERTTPTTMVAPALIASASIDASPVTMTIGIDDGR